MHFNIAVLPGDGIGPEVTNEAVKVLEAVGEQFSHDFNLHFGRIGGNAIDRTGTPLPDETVEMCQRVDAILFGAVGGPQWDSPDADIRPEQGILEIRKNLDLFANIRPVKVYPALINCSPVKPTLLEGVDMIIVRELTGGLYFSKPKKRWQNSRGRRGVDTMRYTEEEIERIVRVGFDLAQGRRKLLTSADKFNVLESSRLWREIANEVSQDYPDVELEHILADNLSMQLIREPGHYDVIVAENTFGDILSDEASVLSGSLGLLPSASLANLPNEAVSGGRNPISGLGLYEPIHGSAPDITGEGVANPIASILSTAMLLRLSLGLESEAQAIENAIEAALAEGYRTPDIASDGGSVVTTSEMGEVIAGLV